jgi:hypothetical protein
MNRKDPKWDLKNHSFIEICLKHVWDFGVWSLEH